MYTTGLYLKNIGDCVPSQDESIGTPLDSPLFWLDNFFTLERMTKYKELWPNDGAMVISGWNLLPPPHLWVLNCPIVLLPKNTQNGIPKACLSSFNSWRKNC